MYLTSPFIVKMEIVDTYSTHPVIKFIYTFSICMKFGVENSCLYEMVAVLTWLIFPPCFLI